MPAKACVKTGETLVVALETREREGEVAFISSHQQTRYPEDRVSSPQMMETENDLTPPRSLEESQTWAKDSVRDLPAVGPISRPEGLGPSPASACSAHAASGSITARLISSKGDCGFLSEGVG